MDLARDQECRMFLHTGPWTCITSQSITIKLSHKANIYDQCKFVIDLQCFTFDRKDLPEQMKLKIDL